MRLMLAFLLLAGAATRLPADPALDARVLKLFDDKCADCHSPTKHKNDKAKKPALDGAVDLQALRQNAKVVHPGDAASSKLYQVLLLARTDKDSMPHSTRSQPRDPLPPGEIELIKAWIDAP